MKAVVIVLFVFAALASIVLLIEAIRVVSAVAKLQAKEYQRYLIVTAETFQTCRPIIRAKVVTCKPDELINYLYDENETVVSVVKLD